jgi:hypothetical protein
VGSAKSMKLTIDAIVSCIMLKTCIKGYEFDMVI